MRTALLKRCLRNKKTNFGDNRYIKDMAEQMEEAQEDWNRNRHKTVAAVRAWCSLNYWYNGDKGVKSLIL